MNNNPQMPVFSRPSENVIQKAPPHPELQKRLDEEFEKHQSRNFSNLLLQNLLKDRRNQIGLNDGLLYPGKLFPLGTSVATVRAAAAAQAPARGRINCLVVLVDFPGQEFCTPNQHFQDLFFSTGRKISTGSMREYYQEVTNNKIDLVGDVVGPFTLPYTQSQYTHGESGLGQEYPSGRTMARDAAIAACTNLSLSAYDNNKDGFVDAFIIVHAGTGAETTRDPEQGANLMWAHKSIIEGEAYPGADGTTVYGYLTVPEDCNIGVCAHELGHLLFGFPDLYNGSQYKPGTGIGNWCLMSGGTWNNGGLTPAHPSAWCKVQQGWVTVETPKSNLENVTILDVKTSFNVKLLWKNGVAGSEYFLIENRQQTKFDKYLPGAGLLIWHIDETMEDNTSGVHYKVALKQADGASQLETTSNYGDEGDPYPGERANKSFTQNSMPNSLSYGSVDSGVQIFDIKQNGSDIRCSIKVT